jgi:hypothetical protein
MPDDTAVRRVVQPYGEHLVTQQGIEERAAASLAQRRANCEVMTYVVDGWMVREWPNQRIERLCPADRFKAEDYPLPST